ncbi:MAG: hypothetical protein RIC35_18530 [Marinoscillum sp.]
MKKTLLALGMVVLIYGTVLSKPDPDSGSKPSINVSPVEEGKFNLSLSTDNSGFAKFRILNNKGHVMISKRINYDHSFSLPINMAGLEEGVYNVQLITENEQISQEVFLSHLYRQDVAVFISEPEANIFNLKVFHENVPVKILIEDKNGKLYYEETITSSRNFEKRFDLTKLKGKDFNMVIQGEKSYIVKSL